MKTKASALTVVLFFYFSIINLSAQGTPFISGNTSPSPGAAALGEQGNVPVNMYSGSAQVDVPLFQVKSNHQSIPISLGYSSQGNKVEQMASNVGLGWGLAAGGVITRSVNGLPDDCKTLYYPNSGISANNAGYLYATDDYIESLYDRPVWEYTEVDRQNIGNRKRDTEPDVFFFNFSGATGQFVFDKNGEVKFFSKADLKISYNLNDFLSLQDDNLGFTSPYTGGIEDFTITTPDGVKYIFAKREIVYSKSKEYSGPELINPCSPLISNLYSFEFNQNNIPENESPAVGFTKSWFLTEIINPFGIVEFQFNYAVTEVIPDNVMVEQVVDRYFNLNDIDECEPGNGIDNTFKNYSIETAVISPRLTSIDYGFKDPNGSGSGFSKYGDLRFVYDTNTRDDVFYPNNVSLGAYEQTRALKKIEWWTNRKMKEVEFYYDYFFSDCLNVTSYDCMFPPGVVESCDDCTFGCEPIFPDLNEKTLAHSKRLRLNSVIERGTDDDDVEVENRPFRFEYNETPLPSRLSPNQDLWGYFNGGEGPNTYLPTLYAYPRPADQATNAVNQSVYSVFPRQSNVDPPIIIQKADRGANEQAAQANILTRVTYPTGGYSSFSYGLHEFDFDIYTQSGGGLRIEEIVTSDGNGLDNVKSYSYLKEAGGTSGKLINFPHHGMFIGCLTNCSESQLEDAIADNTAMYSHSRTPLGTTYGAPVGYSRVIENNGSDGYSENFFNLTAYHGVESADNNIYRRAYAEDNLQNFNCEESIFPYPLNPNYDWSNGLLLESRLYGPEGIVLKVENDYEWTEFEEILSVKGHVVGGPNTPTNLYHIVAGKTFFFSGDKRLTEKRTTHYGDDGGELETIINYNFGSDHHVLPTEITTTTNNGQSTYVTENIYATDAVGEDNAEQQAINELKDPDVFRVYTLIESINRKDGIIIGGVKTKYRKFQQGGNGYVVAPFEHYYRGEEDIGLILGSTTTYYIVGERKGFLNTETKPGFNSTHYTWQGGTLVTKFVVNPNASWNWEWNYGYNDARMLTSITDYNGQTVRYQYDGLLRQSRVEIKNGIVTSVKAYSIGGLIGNTVTNFTDYGEPQSNNSETQYSISYFDGLGRPTRVDALGHSTSGGNVTLKNRIYDDQGRVVVSDELQNGTTSTSYDGSPLGRVRSISYSGPGGSRYRYLINKFLVGGQYLPSQLFETEVIDANDHITTVFKDKKGRTVAKKNALGDWTHYLYDEYDRIWKVVPPGATAADNDLCYRYEYDERHRVIRKYIPGADYVDYVYNNRDEPVLTQDGKLRLEGRWMCTQYDLFGRPVATGFHSGSADPNATPQAPFLTTFTYDIGGGACKGKVTASSSIVLNPDGTFGDELNSEIRYDGFGRVIYTVGENHIGGKNSLGTSYDNSDKVWTENAGHTSRLSNTSLQNNYNYDHGGRKDWMTYSVNQDALQLLTYEYNGKDQLVEKNIHQSPGSWPGGDSPPTLQSIDYGYNGRGWLTLINPISERLPQNKLAACGGITEEDCTIQIEPEEPKCDLECKGVDVTLEQFISIRLEEEDIRTDCYIPCECEKEKCVEEKPNCPPSEIALQQASFAVLQSEIGNVDPSKLDYPTTLYRLKLCSGEEPHVLKKEMPIIKGSYTLMQEVRVVSPTQQFKVKTNASSSIQTVDFSTVLNLRETTPEFNLDEYIPCDDKASGGTETCDFSAFYYAKSIGRSTAFSTYDGVEPYLDMTEYYPNSENSLEDDAVFWQIGPSRTRELQEAEWDISYDFGNVQNVQLSTYFVRVKIEDVLLNEHAKLRLGLYDGTSLVPLSGGQDYKEISSGDQGLAYSLVPDQILTRSQVENMKVVVATSAAFYNYVNIDYVSVNFKYSTSCGETCDTGPECSTEGKAAQENSLHLIREEMEKLNVADISFPTKLYRVRLCDKSEINLFEQELTLLLGGYVVLDEIEIQSSSQKVSVDYGNPDSRDLFMEEINYGSPNSDLDAPIQRNGNISYVRWRVAKQSIKAYGYQYDAINRLKKANFGEYVIDDKNRICELYLGGYDVYGDDTGETIRYDARGNIENLKRKGALSTCGNNSYNYGVIDDITYDYITGTNELRWVDEQASEEKGFTNGVATGGDFDYDENGNMIYDPHKNISIVYNHLDLPIQITSNDGTISFWYDSFGKKLRMEVTSAQGTTRIDYGGITDYVNGNIESINQGDGRILTNSSGGYIYQYVLRDHLGNSRISFADLNNNGIIEVADSPGGYTEIMQEDHYYPFGMKQEGSWTPTSDVENRYQYNGIEHLGSDLLGLNVNMATFRTLDPSLGRWWGIDSAVESYKEFTPYNSMFNNPVSFTDPEGDAAWAISGAISSAINIGGYLLTHMGDDFSWGGFFASAATGFINGALFGDPFTKGGLIKNPIAKGASGFGKLRLNVRGGVGTDGAGIGLELVIGIGIPKTDIDVAALSASLNFKSSFIGTKKAGVEGRIGLGFGLTHKGYGAMVGLNVYGDMVGTSQTTTYAKLSFGQTKNDKDRYFLIENDAVFDGGDRWRTGGLRYQHGDAFSIGLSVFTGDPGITGDRDRGPDPDTGDITYNKEGVNDYRAGILYIGIGKHRVGANSEYLRSTIQNGLHDLKFLDDPHFKKLTGKEYELPYYYYGNGSHFSTY